MKNMKKMTKIFGAGIVVILITLSINIAVAKNECGGQGGPNILGCAPPCVPPLPTGDDTPTYEPCVWICVVRDDTGAVRMAVISIYGEIITTDMDTNGDGWADTYVIDADGDGVGDTKYVDTDHVETDGNYTYDEVYRLVDGDFVISDDPDDPTDIKCNKMDIYDCYDDCWVVR